MKKATLFFMLLAWIAQAQTTERKSGVEVGPFTGQFLVSTDLSSVYMNMIGAGIRYSNGNTSISFSVFPTLRFFNDPQPDKSDPKRPFVTPGFAAGPLLQYKRLFVGFPAFYDGEYTRWRFTMGIGIKIGKL